ncbi:MAG: helix-turn-helix domain-containing protein [Faecalicatena sp.]|uniref:helix-turn-helix domain-containing protein n=1 Tax=Faecalicatena sp. TaxID=2005360 RepID=UPI00258AEA38|nr:helix-turn-helix transcriptional regulator [Faecalicatena sp.]MCI6464725.1 helix-turn-helix domain-containing protein [Faecalicatena sp.]MDY5618303.1 helix-turn-helix transcriptional regulator [Lachnospiraceae bacterium]
MNERIRILRKELKLSQEEFGKRVGVSNTAISKLEKGERSLTEQMILSICREFRVNYFWLTEGHGDIFTGTPQTVVDELAEDYNLDDIDKKVIEKYLALDTEKRAVIKEYLKSIFT